MPSASSSPRPTASRISSSDGCRTPTASSRPTIGARATAYSDIGAGEDVARRLVGATLGLERDSHDASALDGLVERDRAAAAREEPGGLRALSLYHPRLVGLRGGRLIEADDERTLFAVDNQIARRPLDRDDALCRPGSQRVRPQPEPDGGHRRGSGSNRGGREEPPAPDRHYGGDPGLGPRRGQDARAELR